MSQPNVVNINGEWCDPRQANEMVIRRLEDLLERARSGDIISFAGVAECFDHSILNIFAGQSSGNAAVGGLFRLVTELASQ